MGNMDLIIRNANVATSQSRFVCDIGVVAGQIYQIGEINKTAEKELDATGFLITPGGVDSHCHVEQIARMAFGQLMTGSAQVGLLFAAAPPLLSPSPANTGAKA